MYTPRHFKNDNQEELLQFIRENGFGILISEVNNRPWATHVPLILSEDNKKLYTHISRGNMQWKHLDPEKEMLAIFNGPHAYVSSSWYDHENVPTWNYVAVQVYGKPRIIEGDELMEALKKLTNKYEAKSEHPVSVEKMTPSYLAKEIRGIVGFEITITQIEASYKLSQNRDKENYKNIIRRLEENEDPNTQAVASIMRKRSPHQEF